MVKQVIVALLALTATAAAEEDDSESDPAFNMFGFRIGIGALPIAGNDTLTIGFGLGVEHPVFKKTRVFGEYEWLWLTERERQQQMGPERHGNGHRAHLGIRRELAGKGRRKLHVFVDGELGGGAALTNHNMAGMEAIPHAFIGLRGGYDLYSRSEESPSRTFEAEFLLRAVAIPTGIGMMFGVGMAWGN